MRLDHLNAVGPPGSRNTVVQRNASGPTAFKRSEQIGGVTTCETPSHHAGDLNNLLRSAVGPGVAVPPRVAFQDLVQPPRVQQAPDLNDRLVIGGVEAEGG